MRAKLAMLADGTVSPETLNALVRLQDAVAEQVAKSASQHLTRSRPRTAKTPLATG